MKNIYLDFYHRKSFADTKDAESLLKLILEDPTFSPDKWAPFEPVNRPFNPQTLRAAAECFANFENMQQKNPREKWISSILLKRTKVPKYFATFEWSHLPHRPFSMSYFSVVASWLKTADRLETLLNFSKKLYSGFGGFWFACIASDEELEEKRRLKWFRPDKDHQKGGYIIEGSPGLFLEKCIPGIFWGNYFGPFYVDWFGREKFKTLPSVYKEEMPDGGIFFTIANSPFDWNTEKARQMAESVKRHLGADAFFDLPALKKELEEAIKSGVTVTNDLPKKLLPPCRVPSFPFEIH